MLKCLFASFGLLVLSANAGAAAVITKPDAKGDEVIFYYDARQDMRSIIAIPNEGVVPLRVRIRFHGENFNQYFERFVAVEGGASAVLISDNLVAEGLAPTVGIGFAVAVNGANQPITTRALSGVYLAANARSKMGTGRTILARSATTFFGTPVPVGSMIDGTNVALAQIQPKRLSLPSFFNPEHIEPEELAFFCFNDTPAGEVVAALTTWEVNATRDDGSSYGRATVNVNGTSVVRIGNMLGPVGDSRLLGGSAIFTAHPISAQNCLVFSTQAFGTFGIGFPLPASETSFEAEVSAIFSRSCATSISCHVRQGFGQADLDAESAYRTLCGAGNSCEPQLSVGGRPYIVPGNADESFLVQRVEGVFTPRMPLGGLPLSGHEIAVIRSWILEGAKNN